VRRLLFGFFLTAPAIFGVASIAAEPIHVSIAGKLGVVLPQIATPLGTAPGGELEIGVITPLVGGRLGVFVAGSYAQPTVTRTSQPDPRLPASYDGTQTQRELTTGLVAVMRLHPGLARWNVYGGLGVRAYFLQTLTVGDAGGAEFGENREQSTRIGGVGLAGGELRAGPGSATAELQLASSGLPHTITGDVTTTSLSLLVGYRLRL